MSNKLLARTFNNKKGLGYTAKNMAPRHSKTRRRACLLLSRLYRPTDHHLWLIRSPLDFFSPALFFFPLPKRHTGRRETRVRYIKWCSSSASLLSGWAWLSAELREELCDDYHLMIPSLSRWWDCKLASSSSILMYSARCGKSFWSLCIDVIYN